MLVQVEKAALTLGGKSLFRDLNLTLAEGEHVGLVGPNGCGKSSLFRLIVGDLEVDGGSVKQRRGIRIGHLPQDLDVSPGQPLLQYVRRSVPGREEIERQLARTQAELESNESGHATLSDQALMELSAQLADLHEQLAQFEAHYADHVALRILAGLGFAPAEHERDIGELSGGWKMRAVLASLLFAQPDMLLLDEPTNHLDMPSVAWLSAFLQRYRRAFVLVSHDREFLNEQIRRVISFEPEGVRTYSGNYDDYVAARSEESEVLANRAKNLQRQREQAEAFVNRFRAQANKARAVQSRIKALNKMDQVETVGSHQTIHFRFPSSQRTSKQVLTVRGLSKRFGKHTVLDDVDLSVQAGDRIAIIGANGAGKTTLLKTLAGELAKDDGEIQFGHHVEVSYFAQHHTETLSCEVSVFDEVNRRAEGQSPTQVRTLLGALLFSGDDVDKRIEVLSGGERARVALARVLVTPGNFLLMDEPTNHLDMLSSDRLAEALESFDGTFVFVSHNRSFVRHLATRIWNVEGGQVEVYPGSLDEYMQSSVRRLEVAGDGSGKLQNTSGPAPDKGADERGKGRGGRAEEKARKRREAEIRALRREKVGPLQTELQNVEAAIERLETEQKDLSDRLSLPDVYGNQQEAAELMTKSSQVAVQLDEHNQRWETLALELEEAEAALVEELE